MPSELLNKSGTLLYVSDAIRLLRQNSARPANYLIQSGDDFNGKATRDPS